MAVHNAVGALVGQGATVSNGPEKCGFLSRARSFLHGVETLAKSAEENIEACHFLAAWALELLLKAYLSHTGCTTVELIKFGHRLDALWENASSKGLLVPAAPPRWVQLLSELHKSPFHMRYPTTSAAYVGPNLCVLESELNALFCLIEEAVKQA
jgi:HEPN domain-containing protein